jgi:hypothetical protein
MTLKFFLATKERNECTLTNMGQEVNPENPGELGFTK